MLYKKIAQVISCTLAFMCSTGLMQVFAIDNTTNDNSGIDSSYTENLDNNKSSRLGSVVVEQTNHIVETRVDKIAMRVALVEWEEPENAEDIVDYSVYKDGKRVARTTELSYRLKGLNRHTIYNVKVSANYKDGTESKKSSVTFRTARDKEIGLGGRPNIYENNIELGWIMANEDNKIYRVFAKRPGESDFKNISGGNISQREWIDRDGKDKEAPSAPNYSFLKKDINSVSIELDDSCDNGTTYEYYVEGESTDGVNQYDSEIKKVNIATGVMGFSYVVDENPNTIPDKTIDARDNILNIDGLEKNKRYYIHVRAIDRAGNVGETTHIEYNTGKPAAPIINSNAGWSNEDVSFTITTPSNRIRNFLMKDENKVSLRRGIASYSYLGLYDNDETSIMKSLGNRTEYRINGGDWLNYDGNNVVVSDEGVNIVEARNVNSDGWYSDIVRAEIKIDKSFPSADVSVPEATTNNNILVSLSNISDKYSGAKAVRVASKENFEDAGQYVDINGRTSVDVNFQLPVLSDDSKNYGPRDIFVEVVDNAGNKTVIKNTTVLEEDIVSKPVIVNPKMDSFFDANKNILVEWVFDNENVAQKSTKVKVYNNGSLFKEYDVLDEECNFRIPGLPVGEYDIEVEFVSKSGKKALSDRVRIRVGFYDGTGWVVTKNIQHGSKITYLQIETKYNIPGNTNIEGKIYYKNKSSESYSEDKSMSFDIGGDFGKSELIKIPNGASEVKVVYKLFGDESNREVSPDIDNIIVWGR